MHTYHTHHTHRTGVIGHTVYAVFLGLLVAGITYASSQTFLYRPFLRLQNAIDDSHFIRRFLLEGDRRIRDDRIVIVDIDERSLRDRGPFSRWPRSHFANVVDTLVREGASVIFLDTLLLEGGREWQNRVLANAVRQADIFVSGYYFEIPRDRRMTRPLDVVGNERFTETEFETSLSGRMDFITASDIVTSYEGLVRASDRLGFTNYVPDPDGVIRHIPLFIEYNRRPLPAASLQVWMALEGRERAVGEILPGGIGFGDHVIPVDRHGFMRLNYTAARPVYPYVSFTDVLTGEFGEGMFADKIVMIGSSAENLGDIKYIPGHHRLPGVEIHAVALSNIMNGTFLTVVSADVVLALTLLCGMAASVVFTFMHPLRIGFPVAVGMPLLLYIYSIYSFIELSRLINISIPSFTVIALYCILTIHRVVERRERRRGIPSTPAS